MLLIYFPQNGHFWNGVGGGGEDEEEDDDGDDNHPCVHHHDRWDMVITG